MLELLINGTSLDLLPGTTISLELNNPMFSTDVVQGSYSLPVNLPVSPRNRRVFGFADLIESAADLRRTYPCELYSDGILVMIGYFKLRTVTDTRYSGTIHADVGGLKQQIGELNIQDLDLGTVTMSTQTVESELYFIKVPEGEYDRTGINFENQIWYSESRFSFHYNGQYVYVKYDMSLQDTLNRLEGLIQINDDKFPLVARVVGTTLLILPDESTDPQGNPVDYTYNLRIVRYTRKLSGAIEQSDQLNVNLTRLSYQSPDLSVLNLSVNHTHQNGYYVLPTVRNPAFYPEENTNWSSYLNDFQPTAQNAGYYLKNDARNPTKLSLVPMVFLFSVLRKIFELASYAASGEFFDDATLATLLLYSTKSLDRQAPELDVPFNVYQSSFKVAGQLPDMQAGELINAVRNMFCLGMFFDTTTRSVRLRFVRSVLQAPCGKDWSSRQLAGHAIEQQDISAYEFSFSLDSGDALLSETEFTIAEHRPQTDPYIVGSARSVNAPFATASETEKIEVRFSPLCDSSKRYPEIGPLIYSHRMPAAKQAGISPLYNQAGNTFAARLLFWRGLRDTFKSPYPAASWEHDQYKLEFPGEGGLYERFWQEFTQFKQRTRRVETSLKLTLMDVVGLRLDEKVHIGGSDYLIERLSVTLPISKPAKAVLWKC